MRYLELNTQGVVTNIVVWDGVTPYIPQGVSELLPDVVGGGVIPNDPFPVGECLCFE